MAAKHDDHDLRVRTAAFSWLAEQVKIYGKDILPWKLLLKGFTFSGKRVSLVSPQGIFTPGTLNLPLSIRTAAHSTYNDKITEVADFVLYKYRGDDPQHRDNRGLREIMKMDLPLIYFYGIESGQYMAIWPVYIKADNPSALEFTVVVDATENIGEHAIHDNIYTRQEYITRQTRVRLGQHTFREKVLAAYRTQCSLCKLRHKELLDAAHIIPASEEDSRITVDNGISLCKIHHAAFDNFMIGITPDFQVEVKQEILEEKDGPMLQHGLKALQGSSIILPRDKTAWPNQDFLGKRYERFLQEPSIPI